MNLSSWLNAFVRICREFKPDPLLYVYKLLFGLGSVLLIVGGYGLFFATKDFSLAFMIKDNATYMNVLALLMIGLSVYKHEKRVNALEANHNVSLFYYPGFNNMNPTVPMNALPKKHRSALPISMQPFDSYDKKVLIDRIKYIKQNIELTTQHAGKQQGYMAAIGSIPCLYAIGALFNQGHISLSYLRHNKSLSKWELMDTKEKVEKHLIYRVDQHTTDRIADALTELIPNRNKKVAIVISFTQEILMEQLPSEFEKNNTLFIELNTPYSIEAIDSEDTLRQVALKIAECINQICAVTESTSLFMSAQATLPLHLGSLYQPNLSGNVEVYNYNAALNRYEWGIRRQPDGEFLLVEPV